MKGDVENPIKSTEQNDNEAKNQVNISEKNDLTENNRSTLRIKEYQEELSNFQKLEIVSDFNNDIDKREIKAVETNKDLLILIVRKCCMLMISLTDLAENVYAIINFDKKFRYV